MRRLLTRDDSPAIARLIAAVLHTARTMVWFIGLLGLVLVLAAGVIAIDGARSLWTTRRSNQGQKLWPRNRRAIATR